MNKGLVQTPAKHEKVGILLGVGILFLPFVFAWWVLKKGYGPLARIMTFGWLAIYAFAVVGNSTRSPAIIANAPPQVASAVAQSAPTPQPSAAPATPEAPDSRWTYSTDKDGMRGTTSRFAILQSDNEIALGFPYDGGKTTLMLRERPSDGLNIILSVEGQFTCNSFSDDTVAVKFDDGPITTFGCAEPSAGGTGTLFIQSEKRFLGKLKGSKRLVVEAEFYSFGPRQMIFSTAGLDW